MRTPFLERFQIRVEWEKEKIIHFKGQISIFLYGYKRDIICPFQSWVSLNGI